MPRPALLAYGSDGGAAAAGAGDGSDDGERAERVKRTDHWKKLLGNENPGGLPGTIEIGNGNGNGQFGGPGSPGPSAGTGIMVAARGSCKRDAEGGWIPGETWGVQGTE